MANRCQPLFVRAVRIAFLASLIVPLLTSKPKSASAESTAFGSVTLLWTDPGDDGITGRASKYDLRISTKAIAANDTASWWNGATVINMALKVPGMAGSRDSILLGGLVAGTRYYAILRVADERPNWSGFSNVASFSPGIVTATPEGNTQAPAFVVGSPRPSPSSGRTEINLDLPRAMNVVANVYNAQGRRVRTLETGTLAAGPHILRWDGRLDGGGDVGSGVYWVRIDAAGARKSVKLLIVR
ncbi:MAG TPA: FlgD immunoglobulin-like domain containing protein [Candidatus Eisenbacteria bacterium]|nr:FlgD immunoglobulin-like domain containing protein [Candidatus Eisenbacteria bacterium]